MVLELLAPAGSPASLKAAVEAGADSVYLGALWNARMRARNFSLDELTRAIAYCRKNRVKSYITLNVIAFEHELRPIAEYVKKVYGYGADAFIVQDLGIARIVREIAPEAELHASTQLSVHNSKTASILKRLGFKRIVLARELSLEQARKIKENSGIEAEVFAHGALCYSYSGKCLMSFVQTGRSANRGACAQLCRLPWKFYCDGKLINNGYLTSAKDLNTLAKISQIAEAGIDCIKIEGRLKGAEYVKAVVAAYRKAIDSNELTDLSKLSSRGYTEGYLFGDAKSNKLTNPKSTGFLGEKLGEVVKVENGEAHISLFAPLAAGDGLRTLRSGKIIEIFRIYKNGKEINRAEDNCTLKIRTLAKGDILFKIPRSTIEDSFLEKVCAKRIRVASSFTVKTANLNLAKIPQLIYQYKKDMPIPEGSAMIVPWEKAEQLGRDISKFVIDTPRIIFDEEMDGVVAKMKELSESRPYAFLVSEPSLVSDYPTIVSTYANVSNTLAAEAWTSFGNVKAIISSIEVPNKVAEKLGFIPYAGKNIELMISENDLFKELEIRDESKCYLVDPKGNHFPVKKRNGRTVVISPRGNLMLRIP